MIDADLIVVGGGPAGMMAGLLFARAGCRTIVLEKHKDFLRDFRGDTVHPSTLDLFDELCLFDALLECPHDKVAHVGAAIAGRHYRVADFSHLPGPGRFIAMMPQWHFLDFVAREASKLPTFTLVRECEATGLVEHGDRVSGVRTAGGETYSGGLVIAADGRSSVLRAAAALPLHDLGAPIDVFWFRVPKPITPDNRTEGYIAAGQMIVTIDRGDYFQCARVIRKGDADKLRGLGIDRFRTDVTRTVPELAGGIGAVASWEDVKPLSVSLDRLTRWHRPGLLAIGDAAHAMSPVGGVGINLALQDAVVAANILAAPMACGDKLDPLLSQVQKRRMLPVRVIQSVQRFVHRHVLEAALGSAEPRAPAILRLLDRTPLLQQIPGRLVGLGIRREQIRSPDAGLRRAEPLAPSPLRGSS